MKFPAVRTWIEIDTKALRHNVGEFFRIIPSKTRLMAVIKSNAYGHGLAAVAKEIALMPEFAKRGWFGVDSITEALRLRREGISHPILVLGFTLPSRMEDAARHHISISVSNFDALSALAKMRMPPAIHLKVDTGMHRQGFLDHDIARLTALLQKTNIMPEGVFTHFAAAKDPADPAYTLGQIKQFNTYIDEIKHTGFSSFIKHAAATGGTLLFPKAHLDMVRIGMGLYGYLPSEELAKAHRQKRVLRSPGGARDNKVRLKPLLTWKTIIGEIKRIPKHSYVGYDLTARTARRTTLAVVPIGYWHGYDRGFSSQGQMLVRGWRARVLGRISMDMAVIDVTDIPSVRPGDEVVIIGTQGKDQISAHDLGCMIDTSAYEVLTRINPLIKRIMI